MMIFAAILACVLTAVQAQGSTSADDVDFIISHLVSPGTRDQFPALTNPTAVRPDEVGYVDEDDLVLGVFINGEARAYPERLGERHEVINDELGGQFITVSFCPLTGSGLNYSAVDEQGAQITYGVSGSLINSNLVIYDRRDDTLYPQITFTSLNGPKKGEQLEILPVVETTWEMWKRLYPETTVPLAGTGLDRFSAAARLNYTEGAYTKEPYAEYRADNDDIPFPPPRGFDPRLRSKEIVRVVCMGSESKAYPLNEIPNGAVINDYLDQLYYTMVYDADSRTALTFSSELDDEVLAFYGVEPEGDLPIEFKDFETDSRWNMRGEAVEGPYKGRHLTQLATFNTMWFAWAGFVDRPPLWRVGDGIFEPPVETAIVESGAAAVPASFSLEQNAPNPFNAETQIRYSLGRAGEVELSIHNLAGQPVRVLASGTQEAGVHVVNWNGLDETGRPSASGVYVYRLQSAASGLLLTKRMVLLQ